MFYVYICVVNKLQSSCGYDTSARQKKSKSKTTDEWRRHAAYDFTGCCAHADVTYNESTGEVERIIGYFEHNELCKTSMLKRLPSVPLHEHVCEVALAQLTHGAR
jgi:hypothetical protein